MIFFSLSNRPRLAYSSFWAPWVMILSLDVRTYSTNAELFWTFFFLPGFYPLCPHCFGICSKTFFLFFFFAIRFLQRKITLFKTWFQGQRKVFSRIKKTLHYLFLWHSIYIHFLWNPSEIKTYCIHFQIIENKLKKLWIKEKIHFAENSFLKLLGHMDLFICLKRELPNFICKRAI